MVSLIVISVNDKKKKLSEKDEKKKEVVKEKKPRKKKVITPLEAMDTTDDELNLADRPKTPQLSPLVTQLTNGGNL